MSREKAPCGTVTAYNRHRRNGEEPCDDCRRAKADEKAEREEKKRLEATEEAREVYEGILHEPEPERLFLLKEQRDLLRANSRVAPPQSLAAISRQLVAVLAEIAEVEAESKGSASAPSGASSSDSSSGSFGGGLGDIAERRAARERERRSRSA